MLEDWSGKCKADQRERRREKKKLRIGNKDKKLFRMWNVKFLIHLVINYPHS
jgi:hypothetical protein